MNLQDTLLAYGEWLDGRLLPKVDPNLSKDLTWDSLAADFIREWRADPSKGQLPIERGELPDDQRAAIKRLVAICEAEANEQTGIEPYTQINAAKEILEHARGGPNVNVYVSGYPS